jgi:hypothetical protein
MLKGEQLHNGSTFSMRSSRQHDTFVTPFH